MKNRKYPQFKLIITVALKKEAPKEWLQSRQVMVCTLEALKSGILSQHGNSQRGILVIITGAGPGSSEEAAIWIRNNLAPLFVLNIGTCGLLKREYPLGAWLRPFTVAREDNERIPLDTRLPIPRPEEIIDVQSLLSVKEASLKDLPQSWKQYEAVDTECYAQAKVFRNAPFTFHCLKFATDYSDSDSILVFNKNLELFLENFIDLLDFIDVLKVADNTPPFIPPFIKGGLSSYGRIGITVVIPVHNREHTIKRAVDSVLAQTYAPEEVIVVDDCSTDATREKLQEYGNQITAIFLPENAGPSGARNKGIRHARTEWISFLDSDDYWKPDKLRKQIEYRKKYPFYEIMQSEEIWIRDGKRVNPCKHHEKPEGWVWEQSLERCLISPSGVLAKKALLEQYGNFDESLPVCEDYYLWLKISRQHPVGLVPSLSVIKCGGHDDQLSRKYPAMDRYRVRSLARLLQGEQLPEFRQKIVPVLLKKLEILIRGYEKRQKRDEADEWRKILESLNEYSETVSRP